MVTGEVTGIIPTKKIPSDEDMQKFYGEHWERAVKSGC